MPISNSGVALLFAAGAVLTIAAAPIAVADSCDPSVTICQGSDIQTGPTASPAPPVATGDEYPYDDEWYFNPAGGASALGPNNGSHSGGSSGGGGGHH